MNNTIVKRKQAYVDYSLCAACGVCVINCPLKAIDINKGKHAVVDYNKCVGCSKCSKACPASIIEMK
jgi:NAD-dependent dihydropyrimidine dehydrogenase PreA subunit